MDNMFAALGDLGELGVLDTLVQVRLNPLQLAQVSLSINRMREHGLTDPQMNTVCKAVFISQSSQDMSDAFSELRKIEDSVGNFNSAEMIFMLAKEDMCKEQVKAMISETGTRPDDRLELADFCQLMQLLHPTDIAAVLAHEGERALRRAKMHKVWRMILAFQARQTKQALRAVMSWSNKAYTAMMMDLNNPTVQVQTTDVSKVMTKMVRKHNKEKELIQMEQETLRNEDLREMQSLREQLEQSQKEVEALKRWGKSQDDTLAATKSQDDNLAATKELEEMKLLAEESEGLILRMQGLADQGLQRISSSR